MPYNGNELYSPKGFAFGILKQLRGINSFASTVYRDFENEIKSFGDTVDFDLPVSADYDRRDPGDAVVAPETTAQKGSVVLNQNIISAFTIEDREQTVSAINLYNRYLTPAAIAVATGINAAVTGSMPQFYPNATGALGSLDTTGVNAWLAKAARKRRDDFLRYEAMTLALDADAEEVIRSSNLFTDTGGNDDMAVGLIGAKQGFQIYTPDGTPTGNAVSTTNGAINKAGGYAVGATILAVDGFTVAPKVGSFVTITASSAPYRITAATTTSITLDRGLEKAVADDDVVYVVDTTTTASAYSAGYVKWLELASVDQLGQGSMVAIGDTYYTVIRIDVAGKKVLLDRPLVADVANGATVAPFPQGSYSFAYRKDAIALVNRPQAIGFGSDAYVAYDPETQTALRVEFYRNNNMTTRVSVDTLIGVSVIDKARAFLVFG